MNCVLPLLGDLLTPVIGITTATIVILQYVLANRHWRLELYDKRYPVFTSTIDYIYFVTGKGTMTLERLSQFQQESKAKEFLFKKEIHDFLKQLHEQGVELWTDAEVIKQRDVLDREDRKELILKDAEIRKWFAAQVDVAKELFTPYLRIDKR